MSKELRLKENELDGVKGIMMMDGDGRESWVSPIYLLRCAKEAGLIDAQVAHVLSVLEETKDEELVEMVEKPIDELIANLTILLLGGDRAKVESLKDWSAEKIQANFDNRQQAIKSILSLILPVLKVRAEKEKAEAVKQERERLIKEIEENLGIPKTDKEFDLTTVIYSGWWRSLKSKE